MATAPDPTTSKLHDGESSDLEEGGGGGGGGSFAVQGAKTLGTVGSDGWVTDPKKGLTEDQAAESLATFGPNEIPVHVTPVYILFLRQFTGFMPALIEIAAIISLSVLDYVDFIIIIAMLIVNAILGFSEEYKAKKSLDELASTMETEIPVIRNGTTKNMPTSQLVPGDIILLVGGNIVPADAKWLRGDVMSIDTAALTGEPVPRKYPGEHGDVMLSGTTARAGECYAQVLRTGSNTEIGKAQADVLKDKSVKVESVFYKKIMKVVTITILSSLAMVIAVFLVNGLIYDGFDNRFQDTVLSALSIMIAAIPIALPLVIQVNMALGAAHLAKTHHAIVTSIPALQDIASMSILCSDKTGTLTTAQMSIITQQIYAAPGYDATDVLMYAYLCSNRDKADDPIDRAVIQAFDENEAAKERVHERKYHQTDLIGFNPEVKRVVAFATDGDGNDLTIAKGLPAKILDTSAGGADAGEVQWVCDNVKSKRAKMLLEDVESKLSRAGYKTVAIAVSNCNARNVEPPVFHFVGLLPMLDPPRADTAATINSLHHASISVKMITGDHVNVGRETARLIGLGTDIQSGELIRSTQNPQQKRELIWKADGFAAVLPSDKREVVMTIRNDYGVVCGMTGDGVNDAAALSAAQVGIAVQGATDAAKNAADLILTEPGLSPIYGAVLESRRIFMRIKSYVVYRIAASMCLVLTLSIIVYVSGCNVDSLLIIILALLNDLSMIPVAYDRADATVTPQLPKAASLVLMSCFFGVAHTGLALILFFAADKNDSEFDLEGCSGETSGYIWLYLLLTTEFMIFSARSPSFCWASSLPSPILAVSVLATAAIGTLIAVFARDLRGGVGWAWLASIVSFLIVDMLKVAWRIIVLHERPEEVIQGDGLIEVSEGADDDSTIETKRFLEKQKRYMVHEKSVLPPEDRMHSIEFISEDNGIFPPLTSLRHLSISNDGFIGNRRKQVSMSALRFNPY